MPRIDDIISSLHETATAAPWHTVGIRSTMHCSVTDARLVAVLRNNTDRILAVIAAARAYRETLDEYGPDLAGVFYGALETALDQLEAKA